MNKYELALIFNASLEEAAYKAELEKINGLITRFNGAVEKVDEWGKRRLAYEIDKHTEGIYVFITFTSEPNIPAELESRLRIMENVILRYLIIRQDV